MSGAHQLALRPASESDYRFAYQVKRAALGPYVEQVWGWDEQFQQAFHARDWQTRRPDIIVLDGQDIGTIECSRREFDYYLSGLYLLPEHQGRGWGSQLLQVWLAMADAEGVPVRLEVLKINPAKSLYEGHGFQVTGETDTHFQMLRTPQPPRPKPPL